MHPHFGLVEGAPFLGGHKLMTIRAGIALARAAWRAGAVLAVGACSRETVKSRDLGKIMGSFTQSGFTEAKLLLWGCRGWPSSLPCNLRC